ncbi:hypothetical protein PPL_09193 [Heterostelium album PN500]|uniref:Uncharacterized protein n=1 Tax=Heterostelium pallidum (strain ATCC 26659 / Pp 5 / PN500) TaxID=670386 RepID=D3BKW1_HETP5|nr:hypothetical protein PPL_09193 [Heterostelium album PN500]EFA78541.1 hypothetical protein PPL_09193 [Heterostelium album PN500]|eukprot:XP_020430665.1 hypothetical protein PPL_09193 [Heterostelium album PN500]
MCSNLSKLLQNEIINKLLNDYGDSNREFQPLPSYYPTLKEHIYDYTSGQQVFDSLEYFEQLNYNRSILEYCLVSKDWFHYISTCANRFYAKQSLELSNSLSIYQFENITHLYADFSPEPSWIERFTNLKRLVINTDDGKLVQQLINQFPLIKLEVFVDQDRDSAVVNCDLSATGYDTLEFVHINAYSIYGAVDFEDLVENYYKSYLKRWRANSIYFIYDDGDHDGGVCNLSYNQLFKVKSLRNIIIPDDRFFANALKCIVSKNTLIDSFRCNIPLGIFDASARSTFVEDDEDEDDEDDDEEEDDDDEEDDDSEEEEEEEEEENEASEGDNEDNEVDNSTNGRYCRCFPYDMENEALARSKLKYWKQFCSILARNTRLKYLEFENFCTFNNGGSVDDHSLRPQTIESTSLALSKALSVNKTLTSLTISCQVLSGSFFQTLAHSNQTISHLSLTECGTDQIGQLATLLESNSTIQRLGIAFHDEYYQEMIGSKQSDTTKAATAKAIESFSLAILNNNTISRLDIKEFEPYTIRTHIESLFRSRDQQISTKLVNNYLVGAITHTLFF